MLYLEISLSALTLQAHRPKRSSDWRVEGLRTWGAVLQKTRREHESPESTLLAVQCRGSPGLQGLYLLALWKPLRQHSSRTSSPQKQLEALYENSLPIPLFFLLKALTDFLYLAGASFLIPL
jgi:hypothetical protein